MRRLLSHLLFSPFRTKKLFPKESLDAIELVIRDSEKRHSAELVFAVEGRFSFFSLLEKKTSRQRALDLFSILRVWDTSENSGVLIYLLLAEKKIEIVADRGICSRIPQSTWDEIVKRMQDNFQKSLFQKGVILGIAEVTDILATHFPVQLDKSNELPDKPVIL